MEERELDSFSDLAVIASFIQSLSTILPLPRIHNTNGQIYLSKLKNLAAELDVLKTEIDLSDFAVPIDNLLEPGMTEGALGALDRFIRENTGTEMALLYQDLVEECASDIQQRCQQQKVKLEQNAKAKLSPELVVTINETPNLELRVQQRREKEKTRPVHSYMYGISPMTSSPTQPETVETSQIFKVKQATVETFSKLFSRSESRGSINWTAFEAALADLKFSITPKFGSVVMFSPPKNMGVQTSFTFHRPHKSQVEGCKLLVLASRLKRAYGWNEKSFETS